MVVDDGSPDGTAREAERAGAVVLKHPVNKGKGVALATAFQYATEHDFECVITMDGDGQHDPADIPAFLEAYGKFSWPVILGNRMCDTRHMPPVRRWTNRFMSWLLSRQMAQTIPDTQCGYRLYKCSILPGRGVDAERFAAESEILMVLAESGATMGSIPIRVIYRDEKSKIRPMRDTWRFFQMLVRHRKGCAANRRAMPDPVRR